MIVFWIAAAVLSAGAAALMARSAAAASRAVVGDDPAKQVYRRQLAEIDDLAQRGLIGEAERKSARAETARRLLRSAEGAAALPTRPSGRRMVLLAIALPPVAALAAYIVLGAPGTPDQPYAARIAGWQAQLRAPGDRPALSMPQMAAVMREIARHRPNDPVLFRNLAIAELSSGDTAAAVRSMRRAVELAPRDATLWVSLGEVLLLQNEGRPSPSSDRAFAEALRLRPGYPEARYAIARGRIAAGDLAGGLAAWRALLADLPEGDTRRATLSGEVDQVVRWGGLEPPAGPAGGVAGNPAIRAMVEGLAARLAANPDDPQGWMRLVRAYTVMGDTRRRDEALAAARARYRDRPEILRGLDEALRSPAP